jgi:hypothetical protein
MHPKGRVRPTTKLRRDYGTTTFIAAEAARFAGIDGQRSTSVGVDIKAADMLRTAKSSFTRLITSFDLT